MLSSDFPIASTHVLCHIWHSQSRFRKTRLIRRCSRRPPRFALVKVVNYSRHACQGLLPVSCLGVASISTRLGIVVASLEPPHDRFNCRSSSLDRRLVSANTSASAAPP